jgi:hypothetical protein
MPYSGIDTQPCNAGIVTKQLQKNDLMAVIGDRHDRGSTPIASQVPIEQRGESMW